MTEDKGCKNCDALGIDSDIGVYYCCLSHRQDDLPKEFTCEDFIPNKQLLLLEQENKELKIYIESNKQQVEEVEMLVMDNDRLQQENERLRDSKFKELDRALEAEDKYKSALEEIRILATKNVSIENFVKIQNKINEVLQ